MELSPALNARRKSPLSPKTMVVGGLAFFALCSCILVPQLNWTRWSGNLRAFDELSRDSTLCGVGLYRTPWWTIGDYAHLHQNVPIVLLEDVREVEEQWGSFNAVLVRGTLSDSSHTFALEGCWNGVCLYRRPGPCSPPRAESEINSVLRLNRW